MTGGLDMQTLSFAAGLVTLFCCLPLFFVLGSRRAYPGTSKWVIGSVVSCAGLVLLGLRGQVPDLLGVVVANTLIAGFAILSALGLLDFVGRRQLPILDASIALAMIALLSVFQYALPDYAARVAVICAVHLFYSVRSLWIVWSGFPRLSLHRNWLLVFTFGLSAAWYAARGIITLALAGHDAGLVAARGFQTASVILALGAAVTVVAGFVIASLQRLHRDLDHAEQEVKNLSGLLPVCSSCRRIRDDDGRWVHLETYVSHHSEASFSHGLCDDCAAKLYPTLFGDRESTREV